MFKSFENTKVFELQIYFFGFRYLKNSMSYSLFYIVTDVKNNEIINKILVGKIP